jgi:hypothetical protein
VLQFQGFGRTIGTHLAQKGNHTASLRMRSGKSRQFRRGVERCQGETDIQPSLR